LEKTLAFLKEKELKRQQRLAKGACPTHGLPMSQISPWFDDKAGHYCWGGCPRRDCVLAAKFREPYGPGFDLCVHKNLIDSITRWAYLQSLLEG
jgi:hypothetical protein